MEEGQGREETGKYGSEPFFPHHVLRQAIQFVLLFALLVLLSSVAPSPMFPRADPFESPEHVKPDWFFLAAYQFLKLAEKLSLLGPWAPKVVGVLAQGLAVMALWFLPFWDRGTGRRPEERPTAVRVGIAVVFAYLLLTIWGHFA